MWSWLSWRDRGRAGGVAPLDENSEVPVEFLPGAIVGGLKFKGNWNATTNSPALASGVGNQGDMYRVSVAGATNLDGITDWQINDYAAFDGTVWQKFDHTDLVVSVNGETGAVTLTAADVGADPAGTARGAANVYRVGNTSEYATIQAAVDAAETAGPTAALPAQIWIPAKQWDEDVVIRKSYVHLVSPIGQGGTRIRSLTYTNATAASITAYEASDDPVDLAAQTQVGIPSDNQVRNIEIWNQASNAQASLRFLGAGAGTNFLGAELLLIDCTIRASGASQDGLAVDGCVANYFSTGGYCWFFGETRLRNVAGFWPLGSQLGAITVDYDSGAAYGEPSDSGNYGLSGKLSAITGAVVLTNEGRIGGDPAVGHRFESTIAATGTGASDLKDCALLGAVSLGAGTSLNLIGGVKVGVVSGVGTFTRTRDTDMIPITRTVTAGAGLTGGGDLSANRTLDAAANADGSIVVNADDIQVGVLATDAQHGVRGGGTQHAAATGGIAGFMAATDKTKLDTYPATYESQFTRYLRRAIRGETVTGGSTADEGEIGSVPTFMFRRDDYCRFEIDITDEWDLSVNPVFTFRPIVTTAPVLATTDSLSWELRVRVMAVGDSAGEAAVETLNSVQTLSGAANTRQADKSFTIDKANLVNGAVLALTLLRITTNDTYPNTADMGVAKNAELKILSKLGTVS